MKWYSVKESTYSNRIKFRNSKANLFAGTANSGHLSTRFWSVRCMREPLQGGGVLCPHLGCGHMGGYYKPHVGMHQVAHLTIYMLCWVSSTLIKMKEKKKTPKVFKFYCM